MNEQIERNRMELVLALRSGRYTQLLYETHNGRPNTFCFAGLGLNLFVVECKKLIGKYEHLWHYRELSDKLGWADEDYESCIFNGDFEIDISKNLANLARANNSGKTFPELADILVKDYGFPDVHVEEPLEILTFGEPLTGKTYLETRPLEVVELYLK